MAKTSDMPSDEKAQILLETIEDRKAEDPTLLDLRGKTVLADFFLICTGLSNVHIRAISEYVLETAKDKRMGIPKIEGEQVGEWVLMDFGDVIVHIMNQEARERFKLEQFWSTPQPKGALPPDPSMLTEGMDGALESDLAQKAPDADVTYDEQNLPYKNEEGFYDDDDEEDEDEAFFDDADEEVKPLDEEDAYLEELDREGLDADPVRPSPSPLVQPSRN